MPAIIHRSRLWISAGIDYAEKYGFVAENLLYTTVLFRYFRWFYVFI